MRSDDDQDRLAGAPAVASRERDPGTNQLSSHHQSPGDKDTATFVRSFTNDLDLDPGPCQRCWSGPLQSTVTPFSLIRTDYDKVLTIRRFWPAAVQSLLDHLVGAQKCDTGYGQAERL